METPKNAKKPTRYPTPRMSERKKNLFASQIGKSSMQTEDLALGIAPLEDSPEILQRGSFLTPQSKDCLEWLQKQRPHTATRRSLRLDEKNSKENYNLQSSEELPMLFSTSMRINGPSSPHVPKKSIIIEESSNEDELFTQNANTHKRNLECPSALGVSPKRKVAKVDSIQETLSIPTKSFYSSSKLSANEYLRTKHQAYHTGKHTRAALPVKKTSPRKTTHARNVQNIQSSINKGVHHKIRRPNRQVGVTLRNSSLEIDSILDSLRNERLRNLIVENRRKKEQIEKVHSIFRRCQDPISMARPLSMIDNENDTLNNNNNKNNTSNNDKNVTVSPRKAHTEADFSDIESNDEEPIEQMTTEVRDVAIPPAISPEPQEEDCPTLLGKRKFFKSGRAGHAKMQVQITKNIKANVSNGKISIVKRDKDKRKTRRIRKKDEFSEEQATVAAILDNLNADDAEKRDELTIISSSPASIEDVGEQTELFHVDMDANDYSVYRTRLPYNTSDQVIIEQQHLLLDFLISNNICNEQNFTIFVADPENHKEEARTIVDQLYIVVNREKDLNMRQRIPFNTNDPEIIAQQHSFLDFLIKHDICTEENFDIFIANFDQRRNEAEAIISSIQENYEKTEPMLQDTAHENNLVIIDSEDSIEIQNDSMQNLTNKHSTVFHINSKPSTTPAKLFPIFETGSVQRLVPPTTRLPQRVWTGGEGNGQFQIDAGQKNFGAKQCKQCGLIYSVHEPEEEKIHREYHASLHVLKFKGWIDEDVVATVTEWSSDGRILRVCENSSAKRRERIVDILKVVDKELGFSSYIIPKVFVAYFAVIKAEIVGLCLVQPIGKANKYVCINGVDCCTQEEFDVKCGISRIWVSPLYRRRSIATKLIRAVRLNTITGEEIALDKIAFSAPTESGKVFAQKLTGSENFLVYQ